MPIHRGKAGAKLPVASPRTSGVRWNIVREANWSSNPKMAEWDACLANVLAFMSASIASNVTIKVQVGYGFMNGGAVTGAGANEDLGISDTNANVQAAIIAMPSDAVKRVTWQSSTAIPDDLGFGWGLKNPLYAIFHKTDYNAQSGSPFINWPCMGFGSSTSQNWDTQANGSSCAVGAIGLYQAMLHEITEVFGRGCAASTGSQGATMDAFTFSTIATPNRGSTGTRYCSVDNGVTNLGTYTSSGTGDAGDWTNTGIISPFCSAAITSDPEHIRPEDMKVLSAIGLPLTNFGRSVAGI